MAQPLRCDEHDDTAGIMLFQNLVEGEIKVACAQCIPAAVRALADGIGITTEIWQEAQAALIAEVEAQQATPKGRRAAAKKGAAAPAEPTDAAPAPVDAAQA